MALNLLGVDFKWVAKGEGPKLTGCYNGRANTTATLPNRIGARVWGGAPPAAFGRQKRGEIAAAGPADTAALRNVAVVQRTV